MIGIQDFLLDLIVFVCFFFPVDKKKTIFICVVYPRADICGYFQLTDGHTVSSTKKTKNITTEMHRDSPT
jgi:hypothetical protein